MLAGFGVTIVLWLAAGVDLVWRFEQVDREVSAMTDRVLQSEQALQAIRTSLLLSAINWRDALLDAGGSTQVAAYLARLDGYRATCTASLAILRAGGPAMASSDAVPALAREVEDYWTSALPLMALVPLQPGADISGIMRDRILPMRANVLRIVAQVQALNRAHLQQQHQRETEVYAQSKTRFLLTGSLALLLSVGVGAFATGYVGRLERALRAQSAANAENAADLHRLSGRLVRAQEDERRLIARELHDEVGQALTAVKMQLSVARRSVPADQTIEIDEARHVVDAALQSARQLSRLLHPPMLDDMGLVPALDWYLNAFGDRTGIATDLVHAGMDNRPTPEIEICLFRIVQEATTNVARHASATSCQVDVKRLAASVVLTVDDDGQGFDPDTKRLGMEEGLGLLGIQERVADARGTFRVESALGKGTRVCVELPALSRVGLDDPHSAFTDRAAQDPLEATHDGTNPAGR